MRWIITAVILCCSTVQATDAPRVIQAVARNREFLAGGLYGYENYYLYDVYELRPELFGVITLCPTGLLETIVYDTRKGKRERIYHDIVIPRKPRREKIRNESILVADAVRLAQRIENN
jgi:hypothetical protein